MKKQLFILFALCATIMFTSCEGPMGAPGLDGADMDATCIVCHNETTTSLNAITDQFNASSHAMGTYYNRGGECAACHNNEGFLARTDYTDVGSIYTYDGPAKSAISCYTCHNIHQAYDMTDYSLTNTAQVTQTLFGSKSTTDAYASISFADYGDGNLCLQCHQARDRGNVPAADATADVTTGSTHWGPHYGVQGNVLQASGGVAVTGTLSYPGATGGHAAIADACITCHMADNNHDLSVDFGDACIGCHTAGDAEDKYDALHDEISALKDQLGALLASQGVMSESSETEWVWDEGLQDHVEVTTITGYGPNNMTMTADQAKAVYNYMVVYQDHSYGAHNPSYIRALLNNSIALVTP